ncbi:MAG TPA: ABC transporter ATP-binding protein [Lunatimonas sp.]|nr:ABC transporter ATP-binding protein [Lunatimonas sp.]
MNTLKTLVKKYFSNFAYFYVYLRHRIFIAVGLSIIVGILDGFGLSMFLPLLQLVNDSTNVDPESMGNLRFLVDGMEAMGLGLTLITVLFFILVFFILKGIAKYFSRIYRVILQQTFIRTIRLSMLQALNRISFKAFVTTNAGRIQNTMSGEVDKVSNAYIQYFATFEQGILVAVYMGFAFFVDTQFAFLVTAGGALSNLLYGKIYKHTKGASRKLTGDSNLYQGQVIQHVANFKYLRATGRVEKFSDQLRETIHKIEHSRRRIGVLSGLLEAAREPILVTVVAAVILIQTYLLGGGLGSILISLLFFYRALNAINSFQNHWNRFLAVSGSLDNMQGFQKELKSNKQKDGKQKIVEFTNSLEARNLSFGYGDQYILKDINLTISKNETIAFVGESGSGKTTLVNVLAGLLPPDTGEILVDATQISHIDLNSYQKKIGYITQEPVIFNDSIFNNVTFWAKPNKQNHDRFNRVMAQASLSEFLGNLPKGKETPLGNNGINLSGGQKQRISIARELFKDIDILIMDEATSALDSETEREIQENIDSLKGKYTIIIVAHRLSTIRKVDRVIFMKNGRIEDEGTFEILVANLPMFKKMVELQEI